MEVTPYSGVDDADAFTPKLVAEPTWKLLLVPRELLNVAVPLPLKETEPGDEAEIVNWSALAGLLPRATATALESAAASRRGLLMGLQPIESVLTLTRQPPYLRRILRIV